jgi:hypothetical protein
LNYDQNANSFAFSLFDSLFREIRDRVIFPYKIADGFLKFSIFIQTTDKFDEKTQRGAFLNIQTMRSKTKN